MWQKDKINLLNSIIGGRSTHSVLSRRWVQTVLFSCMCLVALAAVTGVAYSVHKRDRDNFNQVFMQSAKAFLFKLENTILHEIDAVEALAIVFENLKTVEEVRFNNLAGKLHSAFQPHQSILWIKDSTVLFGIEAGPHNGLIGFDLNRNPSLKIALKEARDKDTLIAVSTALPFSSDQKNKDLFIIGPVYEQQDGLKRSKKKLRGFVVKVLHLGVIIDTLVAQSSMKSEQIKLNIRIFNEAKTGDKQQVYSNVTASDKDFLNNPQFRQGFPSFLKQWDIVVTPVNTESQGALSLTVVTIFLFGVLGVLGYAWVVINMMRKRDWVEAEVTKRTFELQENHYQLLSMIESAPQGIIVHHEDKLLYANSALVEMFGYRSLHKILALKSLSRILSSDEYEAISKYWEAQYKGQDVDESFELNGIRKDGSSFCIINRSFVIKWNGRPAICSTFVNVSERRKVVDALIDSEQRFKNFADAASDWYWEMGPDLRFTYFSERLIEVTGLLPEDIVGKKNLCVCVTEEQAKDWQEHQKVLESHQPFQNFEYQIQVSQEKMVYVRVSGVPLFEVDGKFLGYRGVGTDNTQHKLDELKLERAQIDLKNANDVLESKVMERTKELEFQKRALDEHGIVSITDVRGNITYINEKFCDISGYCAGELMGENHRILVSGEHSSDFFKDIWSTISGGRVWQGEIKNKNKDGGYYWVQTTIVPTLNDNGKPFQYVAIRTEITKMKEHEATLLEQQKMLISQTTKLEEALSSEKEYNTLQQQFISMASHEFRTPISIIDMTTQRLLKRHDDMTSEQRVDRFIKIRKATERITGLIERTLDTAKIDEGHLKYSPLDCDLRQIIVDCILVQIDVSEGYSIREDLNDLPDLIFADPDHVQQICTNLLSNAVKYSPNHKTIEVKGWVEHDMVLVSVTDHGIGIPEQEMPNMFNRYFRTSNAAGIPGTGIGLSLVKQLIEMQGGNIRVESRDGEGSMFCVSFKTGNPGQS